MKNLLLMITLLLPLATYAAKPTSVKYIEDIVTPGEEIYSYYVVRCSNGKQADVSAWDNRKMWCIGKGTKDPSVCAKKQIKTAKKVCKG